KHQGELLPAVAGGQVDIPDFVLDEDGHLLQENIAHEIAVLFVHLMKIVQVHIEKTEVQLVALGASQLPLQARPKGSLVGQSGEGILRVGALGLLEHGHLDDLGAGQLVIDVDKVVEGRDSQAHLAAHSSDEMNAVLEDGVPMGSGLFLFHHEMSENEKERGMDLHSGLG